MPLEFTPEDRRRIDAALQSFVREEYGEEIGVLRTDRLFEFTTRLIGASAYDQGVRDAQAWLQEKVLDLPGDLDASGD